MTTVKIPQLKWALKSALPYTDMRDPKHRLDTLRLRTTNNHLVVSASNRYAIARLRIEAIDPEPFDVQVDAFDTKQIVSTLVGNTTTIQVNADFLTINTVGGGGVSLLLRGPNPELAKAEDVYFTQPLTEQDRHATWLTLDLLRKLPRVDGAQSAVIQYMVGNHILFTDDRKEARWAVVVMPRTLTDDAEDLLANHINAWRGVS